MNQEVPPYDWRDDRDLNWYFGIGQTAFERSTSGGMYEHAEQFGSIQWKWPQEAVLNAAGATIGWRSAVTARPTAEVHEVSGYVPRLEDLETAARISRIMIRVERRGVLNSHVNASTVIATYFGDLGAQWSASPTGLGKLGSLFHLTAKGRALIAEADREKNSKHASANERIHTLAVVNKAQPKPERSESLAICYRQAEDLERKARAVWHEVNAILRGL